MELRKTSETMTEEGHADMLGKRRANGHGGDESRKREREREREREKERE